MSVAEEIRGLVQARQAELDDAEKGARERLNDALSAAHDAYDAEVAPLNAEHDQLEAVLTSLGEAPAPSDPQTPSVPESSPAESAPTDASTTPPTDDAPSTPSEPAEPETSSETSSTPSSEATPDVEVTPVGSATAVPASLAPHVEPETPVQVQLPATGEVKIVTAQDVLDAADPSVPDEQLTPDARVLRNSDYA